ncbi:MAG: protein kinase, partial [Myxococcota bacterium]
MRLQLPAEFGNYVLLELIARGGMAEIYRAQMQSDIDGFGKQVAIKKILPNLSENRDFITMLIDEARISVSLNHHNIAQVYDLGSVNGTYYIAMEYIPGVDLSYVLKKLGKQGFLIPLEHAIFATKELCAGLYAAHTKKDNDGNLLGIVHRDVSPHNILVSFNGDVKIIDFGVAKASGKLGQTRMGVIKGKLLYMAPEQAMARTIDARADVFAAGLCLYKMLTGRLPFEADNEFQIYNNILTGEVVPPCTINPDMPSIMDDVVMKALQRDANDRYQDAWEMHQALEQALHQLYPGYTNYRLAKFMEDYFAESRPKALDPSIASYPSASASKPRPKRRSSGSFPGAASQHTPSAGNQLSSAGRSVPRQQRSYPQPRQHQQRSYPQPRQQQPPRQQLSHPQPRQHQQRSYPQPRQQQPPRQQLSHPQPRQQQPPRQQTPSQPQQTPQPVAQQPPRPQQRQPAAVAGPQANPAQGHGPLHSAAARSGAPAGIGPSSSPASRPNIGGGWGGAPARPGPPSRPGIPQPAAAQPARTRPRASSPAQPQPRPTPPPQQRSAPYIPSPEELGFRRSSEGDPSAHSEEEGDPTVDMKIDQKMLSQAVAKAQAAQAAALDEEGEATVNMTVPANIAAQASNARRPPPAATVPGHPANVGPKPPANATPPRKGPRRKRNQNQGMMIALIIVGVLIVCCVLAFFAIIVFQPFGSGEPTTESGSENVKTAPKTKKKPSSKNKKGAKASAKDAKSTDKDGAKAKDEQAKDGEDKPDEDAPSKTARVDTESPSDATPQDAAKAVVASHEALMNAVEFDIDKGTVFGTSLID